MPRMAVRSGRPRLFTRTRTDIMQPFPDKYDRDRIETDCQQRWAEDDAFRWDAALDPGLDYVIDTPPPTVSGTLHMGHVYSYTQADIIARFFRMSGRNVLYPIGWDNNGLPTERLVEKVKKVRGGTMDRDAFVALCREVIPEYQAEFEELFSRLGLSVDWTRKYETISDESRTLSQLSFLDLYAKGLLERRLEPTLWDPADRTALAQTEVEEIERAGLLNTVAFGLEAGGEVLIATTRPELIGGCGALLVHPDDPRAGELVGQTAISPLYGIPVPIVADEEVAIDKGTGVVMCCTFGDVTDIGWWRTHKLPLRLVIDRAGKMIEELPLGGDEWPSRDVATAQNTVEALAGQKIRDAREMMIALLGDAGALRGQDHTDQVVPVAERSGAPLEILVTPQWSIRTLDFKEQILAKGREINWHPPYMFQRFESWVEAIKWDWTISRQRHFGVPLPVWYSKRAGEEGRIIVPEPDQLPVDPMRDLPPGYSVDEVEPERDVMDTWATSSVSPQLITRAVTSELGPDPELHERLFPLQLRPQAHDIIRTWAFYTIVKAMHHEDEIPWQDICVSGWCLASDGSKMSKSRGTVIDPVKLLGEYGTDAVRYWTGTSRLGNDTVIAPNTLKQGKRLVTKLWNSTRLAHGVLATAGINPKTPAQDLADGTISHPLDRWLLGALSQTVEKATAAFEKYEYANALREIEEFYWHIYCDNYLELVKARTNVEGASGADNISARHTLHHATMALLRLFAPFVPFVCDTLNAIMGSASTVHARGQWPKIEDQAEPGLDEALGGVALEIVAAVRKAKADLNVSMRAPVEVLFVAPADGGDAAMVETLAGDLRAIGSAETLTVVDALPDGLAATPSPGERFELGLRMAAETA